MGFNTTCSAFIVLVGVIKYIGFGVSPYNHTAVHGWVGVWRSFLPGWVGVAGVGRYIALC